MKSLKDYLAESQHWMENPAVGDDFAINIKEDCLIESHIIAVEEDRLCIEADTKLIAILESYGYTVEDICSECMQEACGCEDTEESMSVDDVLVSEDPTQEEPMTPGVNDPDGTTADDPIGEDSGEQDGVPLDIDEAEYQGRKVPLGKPMRGDTKKFKVYVRDPATGNVKKVNFGHGGTTAKRLGQKTMKIKKSNPARRKSFRARHNCDNPGPRTKARYWSCRAW
jgi:hypothetical protein